MNQVNFSQSAYCTNFLISESANDVTKVYGFQTCVVHSQCHMIKVLKNKRDKQEQHRMHVSPLYQKKILALINSIIDNF